MRLVRSKDSPCHGAIHQPGSDVWLLPDTDEADAVSSPAPSIAIGTTIAQVPAGATLLKVAAGGQVDISEATAMEIG
jgi:hypothetical protein